MRLQLPKHDLRGKISPRGTYPVQLVAFCPSCRSRPYDDLARYAKSEPFVLVFRSTEALHGVKLGQLPPNIFVYLDDRGKLFDLAQWRLAPALLRRKDERIVKVDPVPISLVNM
jgi:hypothetical protein